MTTRAAETRLKPKPDVLPVDQDAVDATLAAAGDTSAFERLYRRHVGRIHGLARRMLNDEEADDVTQAVFIRTWDKLETFRGESAFGTWLHRLAVNVILARRSVLGTERRRMHGGEDMTESFAARPDRPDLSMDFEAAIGHLPEGARRVFVLTTWKATSTRRSPSSSESWPAPRRRSCTGRAWRSVSTWNDRKADDA